MAVRYQGGPHSNLSAILSKMANPHPMYHTDSPIQCNGTINSIPKPHTNAIALINIER